MRPSALQGWFLGVALAVTGLFAWPAFADTEAPEAALATEVEAHEPAEGHESAAEGHEHHPPKLEHYNWFYGFLGEQEGAEPSFLWRPKGMPVPFGAMLLNSAILYWLLIRFAKKPIANALKSRKATILRGMEEAAQMKSDAEARLSDYEQKLATIDQEIERVRGDMRASGESERKRILAEAKEKRARMERDAEILIGQELKAARERLLSEMAHNALQSAENIVRSRVTAADQARIAEEYLAGIKTAAAGLRGKV